ncbi:brefeldin A-inhibited guanine nucleotide-exchange protein 2 [Selaginella moellendorffii]|uniref:brefeldin A-inhibited guanine nucleotide-exchange protein 2 n=1 Tax=Selaginella moellendorffii TaxID=88036 RepID=UPI000D1CA2E2|nr:brefeldin A-inhibited guanine nucleotide-exchange protein 2 [Selaginella moellendorffii]|eukprot:XP_024541573.1 brefeldin A-inhibited guanine nucleotide-exchange protein 2 [Selaginella moellendorffii]
MSAPESPRSPRASSLVLVLTAALDRIVKNASWRKHGKLVQDCKAVLDNLVAFIPSAGAESPLFDGAVRISTTDAELLVQPLLAACDLQSAKVIEPALDCFQKLIVHGHLVGEIGTGNDSQSESSLIHRILDAVCKCHDLGEEIIELAILKTLLTAVVSTSLSIHGDHLLRAISTCYNIFLGSKVAANQTSAKATLTQILRVIFTRMEADSASVPLQPVVLTDLLEAERTTSDTFVQNFLTKVALDFDVVLHVGPKLVQHDDAFSAATGAESSNTMDMLESSDKDAVDAKAWEQVDKDMKDMELDVEIGNKFKRDAFLVFRALCCLSMKKPQQEGTPDPLAIRSKVLALELLKLVLENAGTSFCFNPKFLDAIKQYLCLSLMQNCAVSDILSVFQMSCSIFLSLIAKFRASLKTEIGVFFPMIVLRVIENVIQPNYQQKMTVLCFIEKLSADPQVLPDMFVNYDCDVESTNLFERVVNGLLKSAQGAPASADTGLTAAQDATLKLTAMKCLTGILKAMGDWMEKQLGALNSPYFNSSDVETGKLDAASVSTAGASATEVGDEIAEPLETDQASTESAVTFEQRRVHKLELQEGIKVFNQKPHKGIDFLVKAKKVEKNPEEVAKFLLSTTGLNKSMIGDYLGEKEEFSLKVMHAYVDSFNFHNMEFDESIRTFLMGFRLPGEAQKIDRIMEKFAERYCICNPKAFTSADTAYVLAYSVIMLNTDAHNVMVKDKMSKAAFIKNNRGIDDGKDLLEEFMGGLYDRIVKKEIKMKADNVIPVTKPAGKDNKFPAGIDNILNIVIRKPKEEKLFESSDDAIRYMQDQLKEKAEKPQSAYYAAIDVEIVKPMVEVSWGPMLAGLSVPLDKSDDEVVTSPCLEGFRHAIHITSVMRMQIQRDAFVTSLAKFTLLHSPVDIKQKNVNAIKVLLNIADEYGNYLQDAWEHVLTCVSRFDQLYLIGEGALPDATFFSNDPEKTKLSTAPKRKGRLHFAALAARRGSYDSTGGRQSPIPGAVTAEQMCNLVSNLGLLGQINSNEANKIFTRSQALSSEGIVDFVKALCKVSMDELRSPTDPRVFSLTKIVEISHFNMNRIRLVWSRMWNTLSDYFVTVGCSSNFSVAMYAMDSLRQLAMKFMDREELANYNFQNQFMRPFVIIMQRSASVEIREFIIRCVSQMVCTRVGNVKSGWKITFMVFTTAATDRDSGIVHLAFETVEKVVRDYFQHITETENTIFTDCVNCLLAFINNKFNDDISLNALAFLRFCALKLGEGELSTCRNSPEKVPNTESGPEQDDHLFFWFPLLAGLAELTYDSRTAIRKSAVHVLFDVLQCHGHVFSTSSWEQIYNTVLFPLFDSARRSIKLQNVDSEKDMDAWLYETCSLALQPLVELYVKFFPVVRPFMRKVLSLMKDFLKIHHEKIVGITIASFVRLIVKGGPQFSKVDWVDILQGLQSVAEETFPNVMQIVTFMEGASSEGFTSDEDSKLQCFLAELKFHSTVQLLLVQAVREIYDAFGPKLASPHVTLLLGVLNVIVVHAHKVNNDLFLRNKIYKLQLSSQMGDPPLLWLESESSQAYMEILQRLHEDNSVLLKNVDVEARFVEFCKEVLQVYAKTSTFTHQPQRLKLQWMIPVSYTRRRELTARAPLVIMTLRALSRFRNTPFQKYLSSFFPVLTSLVGCEHGSMEVQFALSDLFSECFGPLLLNY